MLECFLEQQIVVFSRTSTNRFREHHSINLTLFLKLYV